MEREALFELLEGQFSKYNTTDFIPDDPISVPHRFDKLQDIEISGFFAATFAWGLRKTIIKKSMELMSLFDHAPYDFITNHTENDLNSLLSFRHRTFNTTDLLYFVHFFKAYYSKHNSLEDLFVPENSNDANIKNGINNFYLRFVNDDYFPPRTRKHVSRPAGNSACKRINMFLRWMVRKDHAGVDFGLWKRIKPDLLVCPCDVHVEKVARKLGLITRKQIDWHTAEELTNNLKLLDPNDPVKYDFALFGIGMNDI
ncbi:MAG: TIGR02757 family protein [Cytophagales bacterium]|nr:TIGR02757 family protein [Cytophagales bacterium]